MGKSRLAFGLVFGIAVFGGAASAFANKDSVDPRYFQLENHSTVTEITDPFLAEQLVPQHPFVTLDAVKIPELGELKDRGQEILGGDEMILDHIINIGKKIWDIVVANRPVVNVMTDVANALPEGTKHWADLAEWQIPKSKVFTQSYKNLMGVEVIHFDYRILYTVGGSYQGKGKYLANVKILPGTLNVKWGYTFSAANSVAQTVNVGTQADPVAGLELLIKWTIDNPLSHAEETASYFIQGDGLFKDITQGSGLQLK